MVWDICICNLDSGFLTIDYMIFFKVQALKAKTWLSRIYIYIKSSKNTVIFVNATIGFSENLFFSYVIFISNVFTV